MLLTNTGGVSSYKSRAEMATEWIYGDGDGGWIILLARLVRAGVDGD